jgi:acyl-homoserine lactone acylase PvdQ
MNPLLFFLLLVFWSCAFSTPDERMDGNKRRAANVTIIRDNWGIPHIYGKTAMQMLYLE